ncbi:cytochrome d ubiquinol oxidase subunit II [Marinobacterium aestuariivivens]|uniref:Cytochrome d ubiquinol oxidase subunit II n=1 Tax=Marinobacterium aestuariivivens TaxID=1698799 RepID=A0ABW2A2K7_9GAMM
MLTAFSVMAGYALLACCYLAMKSRGAIRFRAAKLGRTLVVVVMAAMVLVSIWTLIAEPEIRERWFSGFNLLLLSPLPLLSLWVAQRLLRDLGRHRHEQRSFFLAVALFVLGFAGLVVGLFPYLVPRQLTLWQAQSPASSLEFMLPGVLIFVPLICAYTLWGYRIFSGKVEDFEEGY